MRWKAFKKKFQDCTECNLCNNRKNIVLYSGSWNAKVLMVGEAPGISEDLFGSAFKGPAGLMLKDMIAASDLPLQEVGFTYAVSCIPYNESKQKPKKEELEACWNRLETTISSVKPIVIVAVGKPASNWIEKKVDVDSYELKELIHPASIMRMSPVQQSIAVAKTFATLNEIAEEI